MTDAQIYDELEPQTTSTLVAVWNVLSWNGLSISSPEDIEQDGRTRAILLSLLAARGITAELGKPLVPVAETTIKYLTQPS